MTRGGAGTACIPGGADPPRRGVARLALLVFLLVCGVAFVALGVWQVERLAWKRDLIARVDARVQAAPVEAPALAAWGAVSAADSEYLHVAASGRFVTGADTRVQAVTVKGAGHWLLTPLRRDDGSVLLVNRGFVLPEASPGALLPPAGPVRVHGLLRLSEPGGGFLRRNVPGEGRWYSRDVAAIASARALLPAAPYFIDAAVDSDGSASVAAAGPVGGLTVIAFRNHHVQYALTWFVLALMVAAAIVFVLRDDRRHRHSSPLPGAPHHGGHPTHDR